MLPMETFLFHLSNTFQMCHKCVCWLQCSKIDPDLEMFLRCSHSFLGTLAPSVGSPDVGQETLCSQMEKLITGPLRETQTQTLIIINALDECRDEEPASALLSVLSRYVNKIPLVKFFITSRPEPRIRSGFRLESLQPHTDVLRLHDVKRSSVDSDVRLFFTT